MSDTIYVKPRLAERITMFCSIATLAVAIFIAVVAWVWSTAVGQIWEEVVLYQPTGSAINAQVCGDWASFVLDQSSDGLTADQINSVWSVFTANNGAAQETTIMEQCGSIPDILNAAGRS